MKNKIKFLGTGTSTGVPIIGCKCEVCMSDNPLDKRFRTSAHISYNDTFFQIDIGPDFRSQMLKYGISDFDALLLTHEHRDHIAGLDDMRSLNFTNNKSYPVFCNKETLQGVEKQFGYIFKNEYASKPQLEFVNVQEMEFFEVNNQQIIPVNIHHGHQLILGYRFGSLTYITDASAIDDIEMDKIKGTETLVINALRHEPHPTHFSLNETLEVIKLLQPKVTYLIHFSHHIGLYDDIQKSLPDNVFMAYDGLEVEF
jgi:phosphoribosyl 1,2-cyclic phosphate phosphodiesterase